MPPARVVAVAPDSPAAAVGIVTGDEILAVNGGEIRDVIEYQIATDEGSVSLDVRRGGLEQTLVVTKDPGAPLGIELESAVFDRVRTCDNHCPFCFIYQLPKGMRKSLYLKDDDYRLSFLYGNFTTLTRFTEADLERVIDERLGPLYVSIHATDPELRAAMLRNRRGATSLRWLELLLDAGIEIHGQVVVCPGLNDADALEGTLLGVLDRFARLATVGVVPLGVSSHQSEPDMRPHTRDEARAVIDLVQRWQSVYSAALGHRLVYAADEYYLLAERPFPAIDEYDGIPQLENGIGMAVTFDRDVRAALDGEEREATAPHESFFGWVEGSDSGAGGRWRALDGAPPEGYRAPRRSQSVDAQSHDRRPVRIVTGELGARVLGPWLDELSSIASTDVSLAVVANRFFGGNIGVTGLLTGADVAATLDAVPSDARIVVPDVVLSRDRFLDGTTLEDLGRVVEVVETNGFALVEALR